MNKYKINFYYSNNSIEINQVIIKVLTSELKKYFKNEGQYNGK